MGEKVIHFKESEFYCQCGCGLDFEDMDDEFIIDLDRARGIAGVPFKINSSIRCEKHNSSKKVGGSKTSTHLKGEAADIKTPTSYDRFRIFHGLKKAGFTRFGIYKTFIHVDCDKDKPKELMWYK